MTILINIYSCARYNIYRDKIQVIASSILAVVCGAVDFDKIVDDKAYTSVPMPGKIPGTRGKTNIPWDYHGMSNFPGGWGGIRTPGRVAPSAVFKTVAFDRSATHPKLFLTGGLSNLRFCLWHEFW